MIIDPTLYRVVIENPYLGISFNSLAFIVFGFVFWQLFKETAN